MVDLLTIVHFMSPNRNLEHLEVMVMIAIYVLALLLFVQFDEKMHKFLQTSALCHLIVVHGRYTISTGSHVFTYLTPIFDMKLIKKLFKKTN